MNISFDKVIIMSGNDFKLNGDITLHHPSINDILSLNNGYHSEYIYWKYVQTLMCDPYLDMVMLDDMGLNFMETTPFEVFILKWKAYKNDNDKNNETINPILQALSFFMIESYDWELYQYQDGSPCLYNPLNPNIQINEDIYNCIYEWIKSINKVDYSNRINPADENARRILIEDARDEMKKQKRKAKPMHDKETEYLGSLMSAISFGGNGVITPFNIKECKVYWLFEAMTVNNKKSHSNHILDGIYHGTINSKDIVQKEIDWIT